MKNTNTTTATAANNEALRKEAQAAITAVEKLDKNTTTSAAMAAAIEKRDKALTAYTAAVKYDLYAQCMKEDNPLRALCALGTYPKYKVKKEDGASVLGCEDTRISMLDFLAYADESGQPIKDAHLIKTKLDRVAEVVAAWVHGKVQDEVTRIDLPKEALSELIALCGFDSKDGGKYKPVHARSIDLRFIAFAVTKARGLGKLGRITAKSVTPYIMDVFHIQLTGGKYDFESSSK